MEFLISVRSSLSVVPLIALVHYSVWYVFGITISLAIVSFSNAVKETSTAAISRCETKMHHRVCLQFISDWKLLWQFQTDISLLMIYFTYRIRLIPVSMSVFFNRTSWENEQESYLPTISFGQLLSAQFYIVNLEFVVGNSVHFRVHKCDLYQKRKETCSNGKI